MSLKCGLLGEKLGHSRSPEIHSRLGRYEYRLYEKRPDEVEAFLLHGDYDVLNVTIPYKKVAFGLCAEVTPVAAGLGNVNVVVRRLDGTLFGDNTDAAGFRKLVALVGGDVQGRDRPHLQPVANAPPGGRLAARHPERGRTSDARGAGAPRESLHEREPLPLRRAWFGQVDIRQAARRTEGDAVRGS